MKTKSEVDYEAAFNFFFLQPIGIAEQILPGQVYAGRFEAAGVVRAE